jgi:hypothetical protein
MSPLSSGLKSKPVKALHAACFVLLSCLTYSSTLKIEAISFSETVDSHSAECRELYPRRQHSSNCVVDNGGGEIIHNFVNILTTLFLFSWSQLKIIHFLSNLHHTLWYEGLNPCCFISEKCWFECQLLPNALTFFAGFPQFVQANAGTVVFNKNHKPATIFPRGGGGGWAQPGSLRTN